jgi:hypothetical protein
MRVALCFWGLCRSTDLVLESIEQNVFKVLKDAGIQYDVYLHTYILYRKYTNVRADEYGLQLKNTIWKLLQPVKSIIENQDTIDKELKLEKYRRNGDPWNDDTIKDYVPFSTLDNHIRALWSLKQVTSLWKSSGQNYTKIIYLRPDVFYQTPFNIEWIIKPIKKTILIPDFQLIDGCNDRFAIGEPDSMAVYGERFNDAYEYSKLKQLHSEAFLADSIKKKGYVFSTIPFRFRRIRANGVVHSGDRKV